MQDGEPVWFGCDVGKRGSRTGGILDWISMIWTVWFGTHFGMNKAERLEYGHLEPDDPCDGLPGGSTSTKTAIQTVGV